MMSVQKKIPLLFSLTALFFLLGQAGQLLFPGNAVVKAVFKLLTSAVPVAFTLFAYPRTRFSRLLSQALFLCLLADVSINLSSILGAVFFGISHIFFCMAWLRVRKPAHCQVIVFAVLSLLAAAALFLLRGKLGMRALAILAYALLLFANVSLSPSAGKIACAGAVIFAVSDLLLAGNSLLNGTFLTRFISLGVYYFSVCLLALPTAQPAQK